MCLLDSDTDFPILVSFRKKIKQNGNMFDILPENTIIYD